MQSAKAKIRYNGSSLLNVRSITSSLDLLSGSDRAAPIELDQLATLLWFIETYVMSNHLYFDGTVPESMRDMVSQNIADFAEKHRVSGFEIRPIAYTKPEKVLSRATAAIQESGLLLSNFEFDSEIDRPVADPEAHRRFRAVLDEDHGGNGALQEARALELVTDRFLGSKCLAGILNNGPDAVANVRAIYDRHADRPQLVSGALINRFRLNYLNELASGKQGAYVPNPAFENLTRLHASLFQRYLLDRMVEDLGQEHGQADNILVENMKEDSFWPPIGLYILMTTRSAGNPVALLANAIETFQGDPRFQKKIWKFTREAMTLKELEESQEDFRAAVDEHFRQHFKGTKRAAAGVSDLGRSRRRVREYLIPSALCALVGLTPAMAGGGAVAILCNLLSRAAAGTTVRALGDRLVKTGFNSYLSRYSALRFEFANEEALRRPLADIGDQVELIFGRKLIALPQAP